MATSIKRRHLERDECLAGDGIGQRYARIKYDDGTELRGWVGSADHNAGDLRGQRIRIGIVVGADNTSTPMVYWPPKFILAERRIGDLDDWVR